jgi:hypothetical protein
VEGRRQAAQRRCSRCRPGTVWVVARLYRQVQINEDQVRAGSDRGDGMVPRSGGAQGGQDQFDQVGHGLDVGFR